MSAPLLYRKIPQCRVCKSSIGEHIDSDLLQGISYGQIIKSYGHHFDPTGPLTDNSLRNHKKHLLAAIEMAAAAAKAATPPQTALSPALSPHNTARQRIFDAAVKDKINEAEVLEAMMTSGLEDLKRLAPPDDPLQKDTEVLVRDRVRKNLSNIAIGSAQVKQMQLAADNDRHRLELGRIAFRMFEIFRRALEACPADYRGLVGTQLKDAIRNDDEINTLLREQAGPRPVTGKILASADAEVVPPSNSSDAT
jgi:hypothetical protein